MTESDPTTDGKGGGTPPGSAADAGTQPHSPTHPHAASHGGASVPVPPAERRGPGSPDRPMALPTRAVVLTMGLAMVAYVAGVAGLAQPLGWSGSEVQGAVAGGLTSAASVLASFLSIRPWKSRPAADWALYWLGSTTVRFLITPIALFSVYSATLLPGAAVLLGGAVMFLVALLLETAVIARAVLHAAADSGRGTS